MQYQKIKGVIVPLLTPFTESGAVDAAAIGPVVDYLIARGVHGLFPLGTTGEGPLMTNDERKIIAEAVIDAAAGRIPVIIHTGAINTQDTIDLTQHAYEKGASGAAIIPPFYFLYKEAAIEAHYAAVAEAVPDFPIYLYDNPPVVNGNHITAGMVRRLAESHANIVGLKDSSGSLSTLFASRGLQGGTFNTASGPDGLILASFAMGLDACVSGNANLVPEVVVGIYDAVQRGDLEAAQVLQEQLDAVRRLLHDGGNLDLYKGIMAKRGFRMGSARAPLPQASPELVDESWEGLLALGLSLDLTN